MSKNNVNQTIEKQEAKVEAKDNGTVAIEPTKHVSREVYEAYVQEAKLIVSNVKGASVKIAKVFTEMYERGVLEYDSDDKEDNVRYTSMSDFAEKELDLKLTDKQLKNYVRLVNIYGEKQEDGTYIIADKFVAYGIDKLDRIQTHPDFKSRNDFDDIIKATGINPFTSASDIRAILGRIKDADYDKKLEDKKQEQEDKKQERTTKEEKLTNEVNTLKEDIKVEREATDTLRQWIVRFYGYSKDTKMSDKEFREAFKTEFEKLDKQTANEVKEKQEAKSK